MSSLNRRAFPVSPCAAVIAASGCTASNASPSPARGVTVYLSERDEKHDVTVLITNESGDTVFEKDYKLSDDNEADEDAPFPESTDLKTFVMTVDGTRFERDWPGFEHPELPCDTVGCNCLLVFRRPFRRNPEMTHNRPYEGQNWSGTEIWIENDQDGTPEVRIEAGCQHVTMD